MRIYINITILPVSPANVKVNITQQSFDGGESEL